MIYHYRTQRDFDMAVNQRTAYRDSCECRRKAHVIEQKNATGHWVQFYVGASKNAVKRYVREQGLKVYRVE